MCIYPGRSYQVYTTSLIAYQGWIKRLRNAMGMVVHKNVDRPKLCFTQVKQLRNAIRDPKINLAGNSDTSLRTNRANEWFNRLLLHRSV